MHYVVTHRFIERLLKYKIRRSKTDKAGRTSVDTLALERFCSECKRACRLCRRALHSFVSSTIFPINCLIWLVAFNSNNSLVQTDVPYPVIRGVEIFGIEWIQVTHEHDFSGRL